jgi:uncharacterized protein (DUF2267 family)
MLVRGIYYEAWDPSHKPEKMTADEFLDRVAAEAILEDRERAADAVRAVLRAVRREISPGEVDKVVDSLPKDLHRLVAGDHRHVI